MSLAAANTIMIIISKQPCGLQASANVQINIIIHNYTQSSLTSERVRGGHVIPLKMKKLSNV